jgi:hypothetical protein
MGATKALVLLEMHVAKVYVVLRMIVEANDLRLYVRAVVYGVDVAVCRDLILSALLIRFNDIVGLA